MGLCNIISATALDKHFSSVGGVGLKISGGNVVCVIAPVVYFVRSSIVAIRCCSFLCDAP